jgi:hypothetical protein
MIFMINNHRDTNACRATTRNRYEHYKKLKPKLTKCTANAFTILHQNICGLPINQEELLNSLTEHPPQIICLTENHLHDEELEGMSLNQYNLGAKFCRKTHKWGVCV